MTTDKSTGKACPNFNDNAPISAINLMGLSDRVRLASASIRELTKVLKDDQRQEHDPNYQTLRGSLKEALLTAIEFMAKAINEDVEIVIDERLAMEGYHD